MTRIARRPPVLMYHGVGRVDDDPFSLFVSPERFAQQMRALRLLGLRGVSLVELADALVDGRADGLVGITFDDGYRDVVVHAVPVLERHGFTATMFAVTGLLAGENVWDPPPRHQLVDEGEILALAARGWEIASHSVTHARLTEMGADELRRELVDSRTALAQLLGSAPRTFCYPYGDTSADTVSAVREAGYSYACAVRRVPGMPTRWAMPRVGVAQQDRGPRFVAKLFLRGR